LLLVRNLSYGLKRVPLCLKWNSGQLVRVWVGSRPPEADRELAAWPKANPASSKIAKHASPGGLQVLAEPTLVTRAMLASFRTA